MIETGEAIKRLRLLKGFSQKGIAFKLGITQQAYSKLEKSSTIAPEKLQRILTAMNCSDTELQLIFALSESLKKKT